MFRPAINALNQRVRLAKRELPNVGRVERGRIIDQLRAGTATFAESVGSRVPSSPGPCIIYPESTRGGFLLDMAPQIIDFESRLAWTGR